MAKFVILVEHTVEIDDDEMLSLFEGACERFSTSDEECKEVGTIDLIQQAMLNGLIEEKQGWMPRDDDWWERQDILENFANKRGRKRKKGKGD